MKGEWTMGDEKKNDAADRAIEYLKGLDVDGDDHFQMVEDNDGTWGFKMTVEAGYLLQYIRNAKGDPGPEDFALMNDMLKAGVEIDRAIIRCLEEFDISMREIVWAVARTLNHTLDACRTRGIPAHTAVQAVSLGNDYATFRRNNRDTEAMLANIGAVEVERGNEDLAKQIARAVSKIGTSAEGKA